METQKLSCQHMIQAGNRYGESAISLPDGSVLNLCPDCYARVRLDVMEDIMRDALTQVFQTQVGEALR